MESKEASYRPLMSPDEPRDSITDDTGSSSDESLLEQYQSRRRWQRWTPSPLLASVIILILLAIGLIIAVLTHKPTDLQCTKQLSMYSPAIEAVEYIDIDFDDDFNSTNIFRGPPTPEREDAWFNMTYKHGVEVPMNQLAGLNRSEADHLKHVPEDVGTGYAGILEVFHQLHCLNMIRMYTWWLVDKYPGIPDGLSDNPLKNRMHVDHCIESLRIALQCWGDVTPLLIRLGGPAGAKADFNTHHKCRNFDKIEEWIDNNWTVL
ncbi:MAG: hypothetical protein Q9167_003253 [Letrouitia subvulpina]